MIVLMCKKIKSKLLSKIEDMRQQICSRIKKWINKTSQEVEDEVEIICKKLKREKIPNIEELQK
jgi:hypothetical protein